MAKKDRLLYQLKVTLRDIDPPIWRRIQVWEDTTLDQLHHILQIVIGWEDSHLHEFMIGRRLYSMPDADDDLYERKVIDERRQSLLNVLPRVGTAFQYLYDFGDSWHHDILWEAILLPDSAQQYPCCITGERRGPPEDVGGSAGFEDYLNALADDKHEEYESWLRWRGPFDPDAFSLIDINRQLRKRFQPRVKAKRPLNNLTKLRKEPLTASSTQLCRKDTGERSPNSSSAHRRNSPNRE